MKKWLLGCLIVSVSFMAWKAVDTNNALYEQNERIDSMEKSLNKIEDGLDQLETSVNKLSDSVEELKISVESIISK